jgi:hypothetical protein
MVSQTHLHYRQRTEAKTKLFPHAPPNLIQAKKKRNRPSIVISDSSWEEAKQTKHIVTSDYNFL